MRVPASLTYPEQQTIDFYSNLLSSFTPQSPGNIPEAEMQNAMTEEGVRILDNLCQSHRVLKVAEMAFNTHNLIDLQEVENRFDIENAYVKSKDNCDKAEGAIKQVYQRVLRATETVYTYSFFPPNDAPLFKIWNARVSFLNNLQKAFEHLQSQGMNPSWNADGQYACDVLNYEAKKVPPKIAEYYRNEIVEYQNNPFSSDFLRASFREVRNGISYLENKLPTEAIQTVAVNCLKQLVELRLELDKNPKEFPVKIMTSFAHYFGILKRMNYERICASSEYRPPLAPPSKAPR